MTSQYRRMSFDQHQRIGLKLGDLWRQVKRLELNFSNIYGSTSKIAQSCKAVLKALRQLRYFCADQVRSEYPQRDDADEVYFQESEPQPRTVLGWSSEPRTVLGWSPQPRTVYGIRMSLDRHREIGIELEKMWRQVKHWEIIFSDLYGSTSKIARSCKAVLKTLDQLRSVCTARVRSEYPQRDDAAKVYFQESEPQLETVFGLLRKRNYDIQKSREGYTIKYDYIDRGNHYKGEYTLQRLQGQPEMTIGDTTFEIDRFGALKITIKGIGTRYLLISFGNK